MSDKKTDKKYNIGSIAVCIAACVMMIVGVVLLFEMQMTMGLRVMGVFLLLLNVALVIGTFQLIHIGSDSNHSN